MSLHRKTPINFLFPQDFVEKWFFDKICILSSFWQKHVAVLKSDVTCPHFVLKFHTDFPQAKILKKANKINTLTHFSTFSTGPIIYYNYYFIYLFHSFRYLSREKTLFYFFVANYKNNPNKLTVHKLANHRFCERVNKIVMFRLRNDLRGGRWN